MRERVKSLKKNRLTSSSWVRCYLFEQHYWVACGILDTPITKLHDSHCHAER